MFSRFRRIHHEFGTMMTVRTALLLVGLVGMSVVGGMFAGLWTATIAIAGLIIGWLLRRIIVEHYEMLAMAIPAGVVVYGIVLFVGDRILGMSRELQLIVISITTVALFNIQFWSLSDPSIVNTQRDG